MMDQEARPLKVSALKRSLNPKKKTVLFDDYQDSSQDIHLDDAEYIRIIEKYSTALFARTTTRYYGLELKDVLVQPRNINESETSIQRSITSSGFQYSLPIDSEVDDCLVVALSLAPQSSFSNKLTQQIEMFKMKSIHRNDQSQALYVRFAEKHEFELSNVQPKTIILKKKSDLKFQIFHCLIFKPEKPLSMMVQTLDARKEIKVSLLSGRLEEFLQIKKELKKELWSQNLVYVDQVESICYCLQNSQRRFVQLSSQVSELAGKSLTPAMVQMIAHTAIQIRQDLGKEASQKDSYQRIDIQQFIDRKLFNNMELFSLYRRLKSTNEDAYQMRRSKIVSDWDLERQFDYLQVPIQHQLISRIQSHTPYHSAITYLARLNPASSPLENLLVIRETYRLIGLSCYEYHAGKIEMNGMEEMLPVVVFILLHSKANYIYAHLAMIQQFQATNGEEGDSKLLSNMYMGIEYISHSWAD